jgi:hypothetical protein
LPDATENDKNRGLIEWNLHSRTDLKSDGKCVISEKWDINA